MGDLNVNGAPTQAEAIAQLQTGQAQLQASLNAIAAQLNQLGQGNQPNDQQPERGFGPYMEHPESQSEEDDSDQEPPDRREPVRAGRGGARRGAEGRKDTATKAMVAQSGVMDETGTMMKSSRVAKTSS